MALKYLELTAAQRRFYGQAQEFSPGAGGERTALGADEIGFIAARDSFHLATVSENGWPYVQHRGGPAGFLRVLDAHALAFADLRGNRQLLSTGNLAVPGHDRVALFPMAYSNRTRLKVMGHARVLDAREEPALAGQVAPDASLRARIERIFVVSVISFDWNCPQHITPRYTREEIETAIAAPLRARIAELESRLASAASSQP